jgi:hypothetical protein
VFLGTLLGTLRALWAEKSRLREAAKPSVHKNEGESAVQSRCHERAAYACCLLLCGATHLVNREPAE